jgi:hypothetical protein
VKISNKFFSFFSSRNQYFPHIPYVASKNGIVERENAFFKSSTVDEYHLPQMVSEEVFFWKQV